MARLDTGWHANPKILRLSVHGMALHAWSISYCDFARSDGFIPFGAWPTKLQRGVRELVDAGLWESGEDGYTLHDYTDYNRTRAQIEADLADTRERVTRYRQRTYGSSNGSSNEGSNGVSTRAPGPGPGDERSSSPLTPTPSPATARFPRLRLDAPSDAASRWTRPWQACTARASTSSAFRTVRSSARSVPIFSPAATATISTHRGIRSAPNPTT